MVVDGAKYQFEHQAGFYWLTTSIRFDFAPWEWMFKDTYPRSNYESVRLASVVSEELVLSKIGQLS